jgi:hypothetical protein
MDVPLAPNRPNFFIVGAPRCGTGSLYLYLKQHPEVYVSLLKEPQYFGADLTRTPLGIRDEDVYLELFEAANDRPLRGEASVWYLSSLQAPYEIRAFSPDAKILILLREPAEMAWSLHAFHVRNGDDDLESFEEALAAEADRRQGRRLPEGNHFPEALQYTEVARYAPKVERWLDVLGPENVCCVLLDDLERDPGREFRRVLEFLGADTEVRVELDPERATERVRLTVSRQLRLASSEVRRRLRMEQARRRDGAPRAPLDGALAARLRSTLARDTLWLGELIGRDLEPWTRGERVGPPEPETVLPARRASRGDLVTALKEG